MTPPDPETVARSKVLRALMREAALTAWSGTPGEKMTVVPQTENGAHAATLLVSDENNSECEIFTGWLDEGRVVIRRAKVGIAAMRAIGAAAEAIEEKQAEKEE